MATHHTKNRCCTLLAIIVFIAVAIAALYFAFIPRIPEYSIDSLSLSNYTVDANLTIHATIEATVTVRNPNQKIGIYYEDGSQMSVSFNGTFICAGRFPVFYQGHHNTTVLKVRVNWETPMDSELVSALLKQETTGMVPLVIRGELPVRVKIGGLKLWMMRFGVHCNVAVSNLGVVGVITIIDTSCKFKKLKIF